MNLNKKQISNGLNRTISNIISNTILSKTNKRRRRRNRFDLVRYNTMTRPSTFGPGTYEIAVTKIFRGTLENEVTIGMYTDVLAVNPEFARVEKDFKYFKILGVVVTFEPRNYPVSTNQSPAYMILNYDGARTKNLRLQDSTKVIPTYFVKVKQFKFRIPKINTYGGVLNGWYNSSDLGYVSDLMLQIHAPNNTSEWTFKVDVIIVLKGPTSENEPEGNEQVTNLQELMYKKNIKKLEVINEELEFKEVKNKIQRVNSF
jgi:hypothetical protein